MLHHPLLYQINTRCWLRDLTAQQQQNITLATVPDSELAGWKEKGFTHIWLMGVWTTGTQAQAIALHHPDLGREYSAVLPDWQPDDVLGSPYSIAAYSVPAALGGDEGLRQFRSRLHRFGLKLILDFVPNHVGLDHPWVTAQPELFVQSPTADEGTFAAGKHFIAHGKDPYFAPWTDVAQLDYRQPATRQAMIELLQTVAQRCDGVRCDMAMLLLNEVFAQTWAHRPAPEPAPATEFWSAAIAAVKALQPKFLFLAEVYWGLEGRLQTLGFDYTYDKALYDDLISQHAVETQRKLVGHPPDYLARSIHFLENHDEPRVAAKLPLAAHRAAALTILGLPGMRFLHEGQLTGAHHKMPVQLGRRPREPINLEIVTLYTELLAGLQRSFLGQSQAQLLAPRPAWDGNPTHQNFVTVLWPGPKREFDLVVINLAPHRSQCYVPLPQAGLADHHWKLKDLLGPEKYERVGSDLAQAGLYLDLPAHGAQIFRFTPHSG